VNHIFRLRKLRETMAAAEIPSLLITHLPDVYYLCGFTGSNAVLAVTPRKATLFTDGRYSQQARDQAKSVRVVIAGKSALLTALHHLVAARPAAIVFDPAVTTIASLHAMRASLVDRKIKSAKLLRPLKQPLVTDLRMVKDQDELKCMQAAAALGDRLFEQILPYIEPGVTEVEIAARLEHAARLAGAEGMSFPTIVASGPRSALPHGVASTARIPRRGFVTLDFGVILSGYCSDMTRTVHVGKATPNERLAYEAVQEAQENGSQAVTAGKTCGDVDRACRSVLERHKLDGKKLSTYFTHSTGHGVGLEIHEQPRIAKEQKDKLQAGMVVTVEPGVYLPTRFGIRIEDTVCVTTGTPILLTKATKSWIEL
jgi:Xaa-Pro aminopeptidase